MKNRLQKILRQAFVPVVFCTAMCTTTNAQHLMFGLGNAKVEAGLNFGPTFFLGDLGGKVGKGTTFIKDLNYEFTKLMKGAFVTIYPSEWAGIRIAGQYTYLEGQDAIISTHGVDELWRKQRNLDFKSNVWELYGALEFFPLNFINRNDEDYDPRFRPYVFGGVGVFHFNPKGSITDANGNTTWHDLQPLHTEGQGFAEYPNKKPYSLTKMNLPYGAGFKYILTDNINIGLELLYRKTFTDYIDDVSTTYIDPVYFDKYLSASDALIARLIHDKTVGLVTPGVNRYEPGTQRGNPNQNDAYFSFLFKLGIRFGDGGYGNDGGNHGSYGRARGAMRCPIRF
jgi:opacity protein-like surface antigen